MAVREVIANPEIRWSKAAPPFWAKLKQTFIKMLNNDQDGNFPGEWP